MGAKDALLLLLCRETLPDCLASVCLTAPLVLLASLRRPRCHHPRLPRSYKFEFSPEYASVQQTYLAMVRTHDPQNIARVLERHPFHVDSLLQLSEVNLAMGRFEGAAELVKRALYVRFFVFVFRTMHCACACTRGFAALSLCPGWLTDAGPSPR